MEEKLKDQNNLIKSIVVIVAMAVLIILGGREFAEMHEVEPIVEGPGVTDMGRLSDYLDKLEGSPGDTDVYYMDSGEPGGTVLIIGGLHPNEPAGLLAAVVWIENVVMESGRAIVVPHANASGYTNTEPLQGSPQTIGIETDWGERRFRYGSRLTNPLHQYPDPEVYVHPTGQLLSGMEVRNLNRTFPGREDALLTEQVANAFMEIIWQEDVDAVIDIHEARPINPIVNCILAHPNAMEVASMAVMELGAIGVPIRLEPSPAGLRGITHREIGDHSDAQPFILESPNPAMDALRGPTDEDLVVTGKDDFFKRAYEHGLIRVRYPEGVGFPIDRRVGRHTTTCQVILNVFSEYNPDRPIEFSNVPLKDEIIEKGLGHFLLNPDED